MDERGAREEREREREAVRQLPPEITRINLDGPPSEKRPKPKTPKHDSESPNEIARSRERICLLVRIARVLII